ncbi:MAG TPA: AAA family ATPase, partial [Candidatus Binatia bacterium]|nr:AAA family ATPase [Candidatus Binatia bacterium]
MEELASSLILTKLRIPAPRVGQIPRTHLIERLIREPQTGLIFVCAPAGYGKTTLLSEWARTLMQKGIAVGWFAIDSSDDDRLPFCTYLVTSLMQALGSTSELSRIAQLMRSSPEFDLMRIMGAIINAIASSERDCVLIFDDYHLIGSPAIHTAIAFLLEHCPENMRVVLGSRSDPPLSLARLRARGQLLEIRAADLRFTSDEVARFLNETMHLQLSVQMIATLDERTEGWAAGLQLAALSLAGRSDKESFLSSFTGGHRYVVEFLLEEVVNRQPDEVQSFLLHTSVLEQLCAPLCDAILGRQTESSSVLDYLEQANLFVIPLDEERKWYRYHHLFRDFLQTRLNKIQPEHVAALHRAASEWHAANGFLREAVQHALQTQDWEYAATLVEQHGVSLVLHGEISTIYEWCAAFPEEVMRVHPSLCLFQSNALVLGYRRQNRGRIEERLQQVEQAAAALDDKLLARLLIGQAAATRTFLAAVTPDPAVDPREHFPLAQRALDLLFEEDPARSAVALTIGYAHLTLHDTQAGYQAMEEARQLSLTGHNYLGVVEATFHQVRLAHTQGHLRHAAEICRQGRAAIAAVLADSEQELPALGCLDIALGCIFLEQDQLEHA